MSEQTPKLNDLSFRALLRNRRSTIILILFVALALRVALA
jgi:hypothetical protein